MKFLLDTHLLLWAATDSPRLSVEAHAILADPDNELLFSAASLGELTIAGAGADTLAGSTSGTDTFSFLNDHAGQTYIITGFHTGDALYLASASIASYASGHQVASGSGTTITLPDATKIFVQGVASPLASSSFEHP